MAEVQIRDGARSELRAALAACRLAIITVALVSAIINVLYLTGSFFMLEVYDRVLPSRSIPTLVALVVLAATLYTFQGVLEIARSRILSRVGAFVDEAVSARVYDVIVRLPLRGGVARGVQPLRELESVRGFLAGGGLSALFDLPWIPLYIGICFLFHFWIGIVASIGALLLIAATLLTEMMSRQPMLEASGQWAARHGMAEAGRRNAEVLQAMGMTGFSHAGAVARPGAALDQWGLKLGAHVGYVPQDVELFAGSVAENIARFQDGASPDAVIAAARAAGVHELILRLPDGYRTEIGEAGAGLSAGQRQRVGLARALFGSPFLVVLDEPNSNLDMEGEQALTAAIMGVCARGGIAVVVAHRPSALAAVDHVLVMSGGRQQAFGPKEAILSRFVRPQPVQEPEGALGNLRAISDGVSNG